MKVYISIIVSTLLLLAPGCESKAESPKTTESTSQAKGETPSKDNAKHGEHAEGKMRHHEGASTHTNQGGDQPPEPKRAEAKLVHQGMAKLGDKTMCPVMGGEFTIAENSPSVEHEGKTIYFCCPGCDGKFAEDPAAQLESINKKIDEANNVM